MVRAAVVASMALAVAGPVRGDGGGARGSAWVPQVPQVRLVITEREFFHRYDRVAVAVESEVNGYLTVFRIDTDGRIRVLFPRDPRGENFVAAGREYRIPNPYGQRGDHAFVVDDYPGVGYVFAVVSPEPFDYQAYVRNDHWEYRAVANSGRITGDPYVAFVEVAEQMLPPADVPWSFDVLPYFVEQRYDYPRFLCYDCHAYITYPTWDPYRHWCATFRIEIYDDIRRGYPRVLYPATRVVYPAIQVRPTFVIRTRTDSDPYVQRIRGGTSADRNVPDRGVRGVDLGGIGSVPAPTARRAAEPQRDAPSNGGLGGILRRVFGGKQEPETPRRQLTPSQNERDATPARPKLERRVPTEKKPPTTRQPATQPTTARQPAQRVTPPESRRPERRPSTPATPTRRVPPTTRNR